MKTAVRIVLVVIGLLLLALGSAAAYIQIRGIPKYPVLKVDLNVDVTPERVERGRKWATLLCATCHMNPTTRQLTGKRMDDAPAEFGEIFSRNITQHPTKGIGGWTDGELAFLLRTGVRRDGQYLPPYMIKLPHLSDEDLYSIIAWLRSDDPMVRASDVDPPGTTRPTFLTKFLSYVAFKALPYPTAAVTAPPTNDKVAYGRYLIDGLDCYSCHSADFKTMNVAEPEKSVGYLGGGNVLNDLHGGKITTANITFDEETGIGKWSEEDLGRALRRGFRPDNKVLRYPMQPMPEFSDDDVSAMYAYLKMTPKIRNPVRRDETTINDADEGRRLYYKLGCVSCHGERGVGIADLRKAAEHYPTDDQLKAWIKDPLRLKPNTKMPGWDGVIAENEYVPLIAYVHKLGR